MIPQQTPVKNHWGNNSDTIFDFDFYIENEEQLLVTHTDLDGNITTPKLGVDYSINSVGNTYGSSINFPLAESRYSTLAWDTSTGEKELLTISLDIPIEQPAEYNISGELNKKNLEYSFDYLTRICQIIYRLLERTMKISETDKDMNFILPQPKPNNVFKWTEDASGIENYDIIGENNSFKQELLSDVAAAQQNMINTINSNKTATDEAIADFELSVNTTLTTQASNLQTQMDNYKNDVNKNLADTSASMQTQIDEFKGTTTLDIENFKESIETTISTVQEAADKINELEEAVEDAKTAAENASTKADEVSAKATAVEELANSVSQKADEVVAIADSLANKDLSNLSATGQAIIDAKLEKSVFDNTVNNLTTTIATNKSDAENALATAKSDLTILINGKADEETLRLIHNGMYEGVNLEEKFADEISGYATKYDWLNARSAANDYTGIWVRDYFSTPIIAGTVAGYNIAAQTFTTRIMGINHYKNCGDTAMNSMFTIHSDQVIDTPIKWNPADNNNGTSVITYPWLSSAMYAILNGINNYNTANAYNKVPHGANASGKGIIHLLPSALQNVLKDTRDLLDKRYSGSGLLTYSTDWGWENRGKLYLPKESEVYGHAVRSNLGYGQGYWNPEEGLSNQLEGYKGVTEHRIKRNSSGARCTWWLCSPASIYSTHVCLVSLYGHANSFLATNAPIYAPLCFNI